MYCRAILKKTKRQFLVSHGVIWNEATKKHVSCILLFLGMAKIREKVDRMIPIIDWISQSIRFSFLVDTFLVWPEKVSFHHHPCLLHPRNMF